jgi:serine/threonine-protein kinase
MKAFIASVARNRGPTFLFIAVLIALGLYASNSLPIDADGHAWHPDWPILMITAHQAQAYLRWRSARSGRAYRLPSELEWEKAARGVDGRRYPWGDRLDPTFCVMMDSHRGPASPAPSAPNRAAPPLRR